MALDRLEGLVHIRMLGCQERVFLEKKKEIMRSFPFIIHC